MLVPSTRLFQAGEVETGAYLNSAVTNLGNFMLGKPIAQMRQTVAQTFTNSTAAAVTFTTEDVDRDNGHSNSVNTSRYTAQTAGWYRISGATSFASNTTGVRAAYWYLNGSQLSLTQAVTRSTLIAGIMSLIMPTILQYLNVGDYMELWAFQSSGGNLASDASSGYQPYFMLEWIST